MPVITVAGRAGHAALAPVPGREGGAGERDREDAAGARGAAGACATSGSVRPDTRHEVLGPAGLVPTGIGSGQWMVSVPAACTLSCHVQYVPAQADADGYGTRVEAEIEACVRAAAEADPWLAAHPPRITWPGDVPPAFHGPDEPIAATTLDAMAALGLGRTIATRTTWYDGPTFSRAGIPAIAFGPGDIGQAHTVDESVPVDELVRAAQVLAVAAMRFCGVTGAPDGDGGARPMSEPVVSRDPWTGEEVFRSPAADAAAVEAAVTRATAAQPGWAGRPAADRGAVLAGFADAAEAARDELADLLVREVGKRRADAAGEVEWTIRSARWYAAHPPRADSAGGARVLRRPLGVVAVVTPWNVPLITPAWKWLPALMAGNAVVWKPSERATATALAAAALLHRAGVPEAVLQVLPGGPETAAGLVADARVGRPALHRLGGRRPRAGRARGAAVRPGGARVERAQPGRRAGRRRPRPRRRTASWPVPPRSRARSARRRAACSPTRPSRTTSRRA